MRNIKNNKKKGFLKKTFIKICRILGYEIIDQSDFIFPVSNKHSNDNLSALGKSSISIPLGKISISRPVKSLDIIVKTCTSVNLVTQNKMRIFERDKSEYTFRTINSSQLDMQNIDFILKMLEQCRNDEKHYRKMSNHFFRSANTTQSRQAKIDSLDSSTQSSNKLIVKK